LIPVGVIIVVVLWDLLQWFTSFVEVIAVITVILMAGLIIAMTAFWVLARILGRLAGPHIELDPDDYEIDSAPAGDVVSPLQEGSGRDANIARLG